MKISAQKILFGLVGKIQIVLLMAICLALFNSSTKAQQTLLVNYDFADAVAGTPCTATPLSTAANVSSIFTTGGTDGGTCLTYSGYPVFEPQVGFVFAQNKDGNSAIGFNKFLTDGVNYFQFQLNGVSTFHDYKMYFQLMQNGTINVQYSLDGNNFTTFAQIPRSNFPDNFPSRIVDLSSVTAIDNQPTVYFRLLEKSNSSSYLYFAIDNFQVQATAATKSRKRVRFF